MTNNELLKCLRVILKKYNLCDINECSELKIKELEMKYHFLKIIQIYIVQIFGLLMIKSNLFLMFIR